MIEEALQQFCQSPRRWLIVTVGTFAVGLVLVLPLVDVYRSGRDEKAALAEELTSARHIAASLEQFEQRVAERRRDLEQREAYAVSEESLPALRSTLVDLAKETGCSIRRLTVGAAASRPWSAGDDPIAARPATKRGEADTPFLLEWRPVTISISGTSASVRSLLERITTSGIMMHTKSLDMYPSGSSRQLLTLDMELWYFTLTRGS